MVTKFDTVLFNYLGKLLPGLKLGIPPDAYAGLVQAVGQGLSRCPVFVGITDEDVFHVALSA